MKRRRKTESKPVPRTRSSAVKLQHSQPAGVFIKSVVIVMVIIASALFYVWSHMQIFNLGYVLSDTRSAERELRKTNEKLKLEVLRLVNPSRLEKIAREEIGLILPGPNRIIYAKVGDD